MSDRRQKVALPPSLTGLGKLPFATPRHQVLRLTGMIGGVGGFEFGSPII